MHIDPEDLASFRTAWAKACGEELSAEVAVERALVLLALYRRFLSHPASNPDDALASQPADLA